MPTHHYITTEPPVTTFQLGKSGTAELRALFPASPCYDGTYSEANLKTIYEALEFPALLNDAGHYFGTVERHYQSSPNLVDVVVGGGGLPGTPYSPNPASPDASLAPSSIPAPAVAPTRGGGGAFFGDGLASPTTSAARIGRQRIGNLIFGRSTPVT
jgi:hypothetical protein